MSSVRKISALVLVLSILVSLVSCTQAPENTTQDQTAETAGTEASTVSSVEEASRAPSSEIPTSEPQTLPTESQMQKPGVSTGPDDPSGFVLLSDVVPDAILEVRYYSTYNFIGERIDGYEEPCILITKEAAQALKAVSDDLVEKGYRIKVYDAYRPQMAVDHFVRWSKDADDTRMKAYFYPELDKSVLFSKGYISAKSGHSRGSTVDLTLFDMSTGKEADMGGTFDYFGKLSHPDYTGLTQEQIDNRNILREAMMANGFRPISTEWWHFVLVDEPYPDIYFTFPVSSALVECSAQ